jgi:hypothetical protein
LHNLPINTRVSTAIAIASHLLPLV